jgi:antitoxin MazE
VKVVPIGNSRGVRLPRDLLAKYQIRDTAILQVREEGVLLYAKGDDRLSWDETYQEMARQREDWSDLEVTSADGLDEGPW